MPTPYAADKLIAQARQLAAEYRRTMGRPLPGVSGEIAEYDAIRLLQLRPRAAEDCGWDAVDPESGRRLQIKSRTIFDESKGGQRIGQLKVNQDWDAVLLVLMDENYEPYEIYEAGRAELEAAAARSSASRARRGALSVARFKNLAALRWCSAAPADSTADRNAELEPGAKAESSAAPAKSTAEHDVEPTANAKAKSTAGHDAEPKASAKAESTAERNTAPAEPAAESGADAGSSASADTNPPDPR